MPSDGSPVPKASDGEVVITTTPESSSVPGLVKVLAWLMLLGGLASLLGTGFTFLLGVNKWMLGVQLILDLAIIILSFGIRHLRIWALYVYSIVTVLSIAQIAYLAVTNNLSASSLVGFALQLVVLLYLFSISEKFGVTILSSGIKNAILVIGVILIVAATYFFAQNVNPTTLTVLQPSGQVTPSPISVAPSASSTSPSPSVQTTTQSNSSNAQTVSGSSNLGTNVSGSSFVNSPEYLSNLEDATLTNRGDASYKDPILSALAPTFQYMIEFYKSAYAKSGSKYPQTLGELFGTAFGNSIPASQDIFFMMNSSYKPSPSGQDYELDVFLSTGTLKLTHENQMSDSNTQ